MHEEEQRGDPRSQEEAQWNNPQQRDGFLERGPPIVSQLSPAADRAQVVRSLDDVIDVDADTEDVGERHIAAAQPERLDAQRRCERVRDDRHTGGATGTAGSAGAAGSAADCRAPAAQMSDSPTPIQAKSRTRLTIAA